MTNRGFNENIDQLSRTADLVCAYVSHNPVEHKRLPTVIVEIFLSLDEITTLKSRQSARRIEATVTPDAIYSFEDGKPYKTLKRHLSSRGMTPDDYRKKWGLPADYPMVAATYSAKRSTISQRRRRRKSNF